MADADAAQRVLGVKAPSGWTTVASQIEQAARAVTFGGIVAYVVGLFVVNAYLFRLGVSDFSLLRPKLVYTGVLVMAFLATSVFWLRSIRFLMATARKLLPEDATHPGGRAGLVVAVPIVVLTSLMGPFTFLGVVLASHPSDTEWRIVLLLLVASGLLTLVVLGTFGAGPDRSKDFLADPIAPFTMVAVVVGYLLLVAWVVYPVVPEQFGGGQSRAARLVLAADSATAFGPLGLNLSPDGVSDCVELVFIGEKSYVVRLENHTVLEIARDRVRGVLIDLDADGRCPPRRRLGSVISMSCSVTSSASDGRSLSVGSASYRGARTETASEAVATSASSAITNTREGSASNRRRSSAPPPTPSTGSERRSGREPPHTPEHRFRLLDLTHDQANAVRFWASVRDPIRDNRPSRVLVTGRKAGSRAYRV